MKNQSNRKYRTIFTTQAFFYLLIILVILSVFGTLFFSTAKTHLEGEVGRKLKDIASIAAKNAPMERLDLIKPGDDQTRMVLRLKEKLGEIKEATGVANLFIFHPDTSSLIDLRPDRLIGSQYALAHFKMDYLTELEKGRAVSTLSYPSPSRGLFISAYAPIMDNEGRLFAIVGVDAGTKEIEMIEQMRNRLYWIAGLSAVFAFILALLLARTLSKPIRTMARTAEKIGGGNYGARVPIPSISELEILANSINEMARLVQERDSKLKEMSANVAHEIRNPLNSIKLLITLLGEDLQDQKSPSTAKTIETLHYEIGKLNRFLTEFLTYSRPMVLSFDAYDPGELIESTVQLAEASAMNKGVTIGLLSSDADIPKVLVDRERIEQALLNLILNAVEACDSGGNVTISVIGADGKPAVDFIVEDTGTGIPESARPRLFEPFYTTKSEGTGLGLSNADKIVKDHGGEILVENVPGSGARFRVRLPVAPAGPKGE